MKSLPVLLTLLKFGWVGSLIYSIAIYGFFILMSLDYFLEGDLQTILGHVFYLGPFLFYFFFRRATKNIHATKPFQHASVKWGIGLMIYLLLISLVMSRGELTFYWQSLLAAASGPFLHNYLYLLWRNFEQKSLKDGMPE